MRVTVQPWESGFRHLADHLQAMTHSVNDPQHQGGSVPISWIPKLNLYETSDQYVVCADLAGMPRTEISVWTDDGSLHLCGNRKRPVPPENPGNVGVHLMEIDSGRFHRKIPLAPDSVIDEISASYRHGYLWVIIPRKNSAGSTAT